MLLKIAKGIAIAMALFVAFAILSNLLAFLLLLLVTGLAAALFVSPLLVFACLLIGGAAIWSVVVTFMLMKGAR
ncbi:hypothetical protein B5K08_15890 [Rhizobium leguminosarum bv. trifolii]|uniref:Transmembrane protein n=1 Tax=Rhizobium leguminosarum bv. trifolii TaxID=386 RepID=A0A3E1BGR4_RHILT|nr:hypothetical protein [Rhizobium leguminosarum]RFB91778.1 hypothetical protein B5K08_15890 [Rhizobium leguminosarum bv. trifolii]RFB92295.1 hypothetical protein B5K10_15885 [Rhizobium leguminosarum bv. trifolii]